MVVKWLATFSAWNTFFDYFMIPSVYVPSAARSWLSCSVCFACMTQLFASYQWCVSSLRLFLCFFSKCLLRAKVLRYQHFSEFFSPCYDAVSFTILILEILILLKDIKLRDRQRPIHSFGSCAKPNKIDKAWL